MSLWDNILSIGKEAINFANDAGMFAYKIENETIAVILYWIIMILVILLLIAIAAVICCSAVYVTVKLIKEKWDTLQSVMSVFTVTAVIYLSDLIDIKQFLNINMVFLTIIIIFTEIAARVFYTKKNRYWGRIYMKKDTANNIKVKITVPDNVSENIKRLKINRIYDILKPKAKNIE